MPRLAGMAGALVLGVVCAQCGAGSTGPTPGPTPVPQPVPVPVPGPAQVFAGAGDIAMCDGQGDELTARMLDGIAGTVFALGDNAYPSGRTEDYRDCYSPSWGRLNGRIRPVPGNHDYESPGAAPYYAYFGANAGPSGLGYYSFELGAWHIVAINSNIPSDANSAQGQWLRADLQAHINTKCTLAMWHHPLFTSGANGDNTNMRPVWQMLYDAGVDVVLNGHDHNYERFAPQDADGRRDPLRGIREFVVGTGGGTLREFTAIHSNSEFRLALVYGVLKMGLQSESYQWEFNSTVGAADPGSATCH